MTRIYKWSKLLAVIENSIAFCLGKNGTSFSIKSFKVHFKFLMLLLSFIKVKENVKETYLHPLDIDITRILYIYLSKSIPLHTVAHIISYDMNTCQRMKR